MNLAKNDMNNKGLRMCFACALALIVLGGCANDSYVTPGRGISLTSLTDADADIAERMLRKPAAPFPARVAVVRVQESQYRSYRLESYGHGRYSVVTTRDIVRDEDMLRLKKLPMVTAVAQLNRMVIPSELHSDKELRLAAASLKS